MRASETFMDTKSKHSNNRINNKQINNFQQSLMRLTTIACFIMFLIAILSHCASDKKMANEQVYANLQDSVGYVGMETCKACHIGIHQSFSQTGMGRSFDHASKEKSDALYDDHALVYDENSDFYYKPYFKDSAMYIMEYRLEGIDTVHKRIEKISYIIGSGQHTNSHIIDENGYTFQAPITFYTQDKKWDMAPGYEDKNLRFSRVLESECLTCHNHFPELVEGSYHKFSKMPTGIECERCHGPGEIHVEEKRAGIRVDTALQIDYSIVNPNDLSRDLIMDLCQRCHLQGMSVLNEGKSFYDFKPGMELSSVMNVYLPRYSNNHKKFIMASQADRLRMSPCYIKSDDLSCITCHHPHHSVESTPKEKYNNACLSCHKEQKQKLCTVSSQLSKAADNDCTSCHMPKSGSIDIPHVRITDHFIHKSGDTVSENLADDEVRDIAKFLGLKILTKPKASNLEMANAYLLFHDKYVDEKAILDSARVYLDKLNGSERNLFELEIHYAFARNDFAKVVQVSKEKQLESISDEWTLYRIGESFMKFGEYKQALSYLEKAVELQPLDIDFLEKYGIVNLQLNRIEKAQEVFEFVLNENVKRPISLNNYGYSQVLSGRLDQAIENYDKAIALDPDYASAYLNKAAVQMILKKNEEAKVLLQKVLKLEPNNASAIQAMTRIQK